MKEVRIEDCVLYLGDSRELTAPGDVAVVFTDPPYGMAYGGGRAAGSTPKGARVKAHGEIVGDRTTGADLTALVRDALRTVPAAVETYVCFTWRTYGEFHRALVELGRTPDACLVWNKGSIGLGTARYRPQHEFVFYHGGGAWYGDKAQSDVWDVARAHVGASGRSEGYEHPTQKPVPLVTKALLNSSRRGDLVYDPFMGSGTTGVACAQLGRRFVGCEIDPKYHDLARRRIEEAYNRPTLDLEDAS